MDKWGQTGTSADTSRNGRFFFFYLQQISRLKAGLKDRNPPLKPDWKKGWKQDFKTAG